MRTLGRHWPGDAAPDDRMSVCDICGVPWLRSTMSRNGDGLLVCQRDNHMSIRELAEANVAAIPPPAEEHPDGGMPIQWVRITSPTEQIQRSYDPTAPTLPVWMKATF